MGILDELHSAMRYAKNLKGNLAEYGALKDKLKRKSIAQSAKDSTMQFPCLCTDSIPLEQASAVARFLERVYASQVQIVLSQNQNIDISVDKTPTQYLKKFHQNPTYESADEMDDYDESIRILKETAYDGSQVAYATKDLIMTFNESKSSAYLRESNREQLKDYLSDFDTRHFPLPTSFLEAKERGDFASELIAASINATHRSNVLRQSEVMSKVTKDRRAPQLTDRDIKKANDAQPYAISIRLTAINERNEFVEYMDLVVGVKTVLHLIKSDDMVSNLARSVENKGKIFNFIRWTTGEISLIRDLILHIDDVKLDMQNTSTRLTSAFPALKRLKNKRFTLNNLSTISQVIPNATICVSSYEVDAIERETGINIKEPFFASKITENLFLTALVILDEGSQTFDIMYGGDKDFQTYSLETIEREVTMNSNKLGREIGRMISR